MTLSTLGWANLPDWKSLVHLPEEELAKLDIAVVNLACAVGLLGTDRYNATECIKCLDNWATSVRQITEVALKQDFLKNPAEYDNSEPLFRAVTLVHCLQSYCRVLYNPARIGAKPEDPFYAEDRFIHGAIGGPGGTCASLPVVYVAVGRRIGYPMRMAYTKGHVFCRWDDPVTGVKLNIEGTSHDGVNTLSNDYYRQWPYPFDARAEAYFGYLRSLTPKGELAHFLLARHAVLETAGEYLLAVDAAAGAVTTEPDCQRNAFQVHRLVRDWVKRLRDRGLIGHGFHYPKHPVGPRRWPDMPWPLEAKILYLDAAERGTTPRWASFSWDDSGRKPNSRLS